MMPQEAEGKTWGSPGPSPCQAADIRGVTSQLSGIRSPFNLAISNTKCNQTLQYIDPQTCSCLLLMPEQSLPYKADLLHMNSRDSLLSENRSQSELHHPGKPLSVSRGIIRVLDVRQ